MRITLEKRGDRTRMHCVRDDDSTTSADLGPSLPYHDLAHLVVEQHFGMTEGFFGNVARGRALEELNDEAVIRSLGPEAWKAEVLARAVCSLVTGACRPDQLQALVTTELAGMGIDRREDLSEPVATELQRTLEEHIHTFKTLSDGDSLALTFELWT
ncbi:MAG: hypothetical protein P8Y69_12415 [Gammaproteobacteria bacterium]|jgi:hypothetical protein